MAIRLTESQVDVLGETEGGEEERRDKNKKGENNNIRESENGAKNKKDAEERMAVLYSNRSAAQSSLGYYGYAENDARKAVSYKPGWAKAHCRLGAALAGREEFEAAKGAYGEALRLEPENAGAIAGLKEVEEAMVLGGQR